ncbi:MAG: hypothetical protein PGN34_03690 [Methylobacterium frigidaeris]
MTVVTAVAPVMVAGASPAVVAMVPVTPAVVAVAMPPAVMAMMVVSPAVVAAVMVPPAVMMTPMLHRRDGVRRRDSLERCGGQRPGALSRQ